MAARSARRREAADHELLLLVHLDLEPLQAAALLVRRRLVLRDDSLEAAPPGFAVGRRPAAREPARKKETLRSLAQRLLRLAPADRERLAAQVAPVAVEAVEDRERGLAAALEELEPRDPAAVERHGLSVEKERPVLEPRDGVGDSRKRVRPVLVVAGHEAHAGAFLVREDAVAVVLLLVDPTRAIERLADEGREHRRARETGSRSRHAAVSPRPLRRPALARSARRRRGVFSPRGSSTMVEFMRDILAWALATELMGLAVLPLLRGFFANRRDAALLSRPVGLAVVAYVAWGLSLRPRSGFSGSRCSSRSARWPPRRSSVRRRAAPESPMRAPWWGDEEKLAAVALLGAGRGLSPDPRGRSGDPRRREVHGPRLPELAGALSGDASRRPLDGGKDHQLLLLGLSPGGGAGEAVRGRAARRVQPRDRDLRRRPRSPPRPASACACRADASGSASRPASAPSSPAT